MKEYPLGTDEIIIKRQYKRYKYIKIVEEKHRPIELLALIDENKLVVLETPIDYLKFFILEEYWREIFDKIHISYFGYIDRSLIASLNPAVMDRTPYTIQGVDNNIAMVQGIILGIEGTPQKAMFYFNTYFNNKFNSAINLSNYKKYDTDSLFVRRIDYIFNFIDWRKLVDLRIGYITDIFTKNLKTYYPLALTFHSPIDNDADHLIDRRKDGSYIVSKPTK